MAPNGDARPSWGGMKGRWVARHGSPAVVVQREVSDDLAPFQIEAAEVKRRAVGDTLAAADRVFPVDVDAVKDVGRRTRTTAPLRERQVALDVDRKSVV